MKTDGEIKQKPQAAASRLWLVVVLVLLALLAATYLATDIYQRLGFNPGIVPITGMVAILLTGFFLRKDRQGWAFVTTAVAIAFSPTGGRVLGFDFDAAGNLVAADAIKGLLSIAPDGKVSVLADKVGGAPIVYADAVVVAGNGKIYFSDASTRFSPAVHGTFEASVLDILEQSCTGRILGHDPAAKATRIVAKGLCFANGVALSKDEQSLFVAETGKYRVWRIDVAAAGLDVRQASAQASVLLDNLPGYPDNLMRGGDGRIWLGLVKPRNPRVDAMADKPWLRKLTLRLPRAWCHPGR